jgi:teichuronic acid biosynthesis glycosyltransferase TuaG
MVTILLPVHNDEKFLRFTLESLLKQTFQDFVCLIGFNGTVDSSKEIASKIISNDSRFTILDFGDEKGKSITLNKLLNKVETQFICLIDGDDTWSPIKLEIQMKFSQDHDVVGTLCHYINENNEIINTLGLSRTDLEIKKGFIQGHNQIINSSSLFRTSDARLVSGWDSSVDGLEDFDFWLKLFNRGKTFFNIQEPLINHRIHKNSNFNAKSFPYTVRDILLKNQIHANTTF